MDDFVFGSLSTIEKRVAHYQAWRRGIQHHSLIAPRAPGAADAPLLTVLVGGQQVITRIDCEVSQPETAVYALSCTKIDWDLLNWQYLQTWQVTLPPQSEGTIVRYRIAAYAKQSDSPIYAGDGQLFSYLVGDPAPPEWAAGAIVYQIFPDRFYPGDGRDWNTIQSLNDIYGGTLRGIIQKLDYVAEMGFNAIWINPFFPDKTHHGYHATDYFQVNPRLGSMDDLRALVAAAKARGIRLILDFVANHWSSDHPTFQEALRDPQSPFVEWYRWIDYPHDYHTFFGVRDLPQLNVDHPAVRDYLLRSVRFWLGEIGFAGLRLDYALGPSHDFWNDLRRAAREANPEAWIFGEVVESPETIRSYEGRLDGCLDFPLMQAMRDTFALGKMPLSAFDAFLTHHDQYFPKEFSRPTFVDNHDMNRYLWSVGNDKRKLKLTVLCQFTLRGAPFVYNGTEVGVSQERGQNESGSQGMLENRQPMLWGDEQDGELREYFRWLIQFRRAHPVLWHGRRRTLLVDDERGLFVYARENGVQTVMVALNLSEDTQDVTVAYAAGQQQFVLRPWHGDVRVLPVEDEGGLD
jgi:glycosidase